MDVIEPLSAIERLSITEDLRRLMARYVRTADLQRWEELASLFTDDGTFTPHDVDGSVARRMAGRSQIAESIAASVGPGAVVVHHLFSDEIDVETETSARAVWAMEDLIKRPASTGPDGRPRFTSMHGFGHYRPRFTKVDGVWKISELVLTRVRMDIAY
ncbi:nuclear transport factor 2 family protein [Streptomyces sp. NPDC049954]|uniref:nuclear transport factor 2 family protein n=1 Tax=Streptomyces sp. NPDC049954 TaxID=3155779 RepID=UPI0034151B9C